MELGEENWITLYFTVQFPLYLLGLLRGNNGYFLVFISNNSTQFASGWYQVVVVLVRMNIKEESFLAYCIITMFGQWTFMYH